MKRVVIAGNRLCPQLVDRSNFVDEDAELELAAARSPEGRLSVFTRSHLLFVCHSLSPNNHILYFALTWSLVFGRGQAHAAVVAARAAV
mgnify:CR=1 FL=1